MTAKKVPHILEKHGHQRLDHYYWLNDRENPDVVAYLKEENKHTEAVMAPNRELVDTLFEEIKGRMKQSDMSAPYLLDDYYYYIRYEEGHEYAVHCRKHGSLEAPEEIILDVNVLAEGHSFYHVNRTVISSSQNLLAYAVDTRGRRIYDIKLKNLETGEHLPDVIKEVTGSMAWANDNKTLFYARQHPETLRSYRIYRHELGTDPADDVLIYEEEDETFSTYVYKTKSKKYIVIGCNQTVSSEMRLFSADEPDREPQIFLARERDHEYEIEHFNDHFYVLSNKGAPNFRLLKTPLADISESAWEEVIAHRDDVYLEGFELFDDFMVLEERILGLMNLRIIPHDGSEPHDLDFGEPAYDAYVGINNHFNTTKLRYGYNSMTTPASVIEYDMVTREKKLLKQEEVLGGFNKENYRTERLFADAEDGRKVPISLVYRPDKRKQGGNPLLVYGYGSYGHSLDASFHAARLSLLDRGFMFAVAHIRGGQELGRAWYDDGRLLNKRNTFTDFIAAAEHLRAQGYGDPDNLFAMGGSAGGLLVGAVINLAPDLFKGVVAIVPFVDVVTTMLDDTIPLTTSEYDEWGNPNEKKFYDYMLSYSPYDNVEAKDYPHLLVTSGFHDSQVQYWEPAKWVARLRELKTDDNQLLLKTDMDVGHTGATGRFKQHKDTAFNYAFLLTLAEPG
ncbi:MAG: S9 family peptidase [Acidobacteriota bacterium]|nr:S9 family peptidase [Acidobacteriota bacterium]